MGSSLALLISMMLLLMNKEDTARKENIKNVYIPPAVDSSYTRGYDFNTYGQYKNYSDEEIRILRENLDFESGGRYYYKTPGRHVPTYEEEFEQRLEDYIDDNYEELIDKYRD